MFKDKYTSKQREVLGFWKSDLDPYQVWMSGMMNKNTKCCLGAFMGAGKTVSTLLAVSWALEQDLVKRFLVVAPLHVSRETWPTEFQKWSFFSKYSFSLCLGEQESRIAALQEESNITVINRENLIWLHDFYAEVQWPFDGLVYDEISRLKAGKKQNRSPLKNPEAKKHRITEFGVLAKHRRSFKAIWGLSGTPAPKGLQDLWGPNYILDGGISLGKTKSAFEKRWFSKNPYTYELEPFSHSEKEITDRISHQFFCLENSGILDVPPVVTIDRYVTLSEKAIKSYRKFKRTHFLEEHEVEAVNSAVLANKLLQFANGSVYAPEDGDGLNEPTLDTKTVAKKIHDEKLKELGSILEEAAGEPALIAYSYKFDIEAITKRFPFVKVFGKNKDDMKNWNEGKYRAMILHPASAAHGLNFQYGGSIAIWYGLNWSLELFEQFNERLPRRGQKKAFVRIYRILARDTMDERAAERLVSRAGDQNRIKKRLMASFDQGAPETVL